MSDRNNEFILNLFQEYGRDLFRFVKRRLRSYEAEDVTQEIYLHLLQHPNIDAIENPRAFLYKTASNLVIDRVRRRDVRKTYEYKDPDLDVLPSVSPDPETTAENAIRLQRFRQILAELPPLCRDAFLLNRIDELTHAHIAKQLGISKKSVERYILKAFIHCSKRLKQSP